MATSDHKHLLVFQLYTPADSDLPVYLTGNFNEWKVGDERFRMTKTGEGCYEYTFHPAMYLPKKVEYKYVRGGWEYGELDRYGNRTENRTLTKKTGIVKDEVARWRHNGMAYQPQLLPKIQVVSDEFYLPQLGKSRRVTVLLPHDYHLSDQRYPVLYMQDGQNLFNDHAPFGNWEIDRKLAALADYGLHRLIVVAIDHGEVERITEYTPLDSLRLGIGQGEGTRYIAFMKETLKPYIDAHFRTLPEGRYTGVGGSSMGGLISMYAGLMHPETFSRLMIFSPSLWIYPKIYDEILHQYHLSHTRLYLYAGGEESATMIPNVKLLKSVIERGQTRNNTVQLVILPHGIHNESVWGQQFPKAVEWLFFTKGVAENQVPLPAE